MYAVFAEHYHDYRHSRMRTIEFDTLDAVEAWMHRRSNPSSNSFLVPCKATRKTYGEVRHIRLGWLPDGFEWQVRKIEGPRGVVFSDGSLTCGKPFVSRSVQAMLERFWERATRPESRFSDEAPHDPPAYIPAGDARELRGRIDEMNAIYGDDARKDWYDADDIARGIAESLDQLLRRQGF